MSRTIRKRPDGGRFLRKPSHINQRKNEEMALNDFIEEDVIPKNYNRMKAFKIRYPDDWEDMPINSYRGQKWWIDLKNNFKE